MSELTASAWQQHRPAVLGYLRRRGADPMLAEDLAQEAFLRLHKAQPPLAEPLRVRAWLLRAARNLLVDHFRADKGEVPLDEAPQIPAREPAAWRAFEPCVEALAQRLPDAYREALVWDLDGVPQRTIAARHGIGLSGAKSRVQRARGLLAQEFVLCCGEGQPDAGTGCA
jgi:RNA polymerase sigma-70 factor (ECF subfamily)